LGDGGCRGGYNASGGRGDQTLIGDAKNLTNIDVRAIRVDLGVVVAKNGSVDGESVGDLRAAIVSLNNVGALAIFSLSSQADLLARNKVGATSIYGREVDGRELVGGGIVSGGDLVAVITLNDGVCTSAGSGGGELCDKREGCDGGNKDTGEHDGM